MENRYLITGATGFVGACLTHTLVSQGKKVSIIVRDKKLNWRLNDIASKIAIYQSNLLDPSLKELVNKIKPDIIFHLAAYGTLPQNSDVDQMIDTNIKGTLNLINALKEKKRKSSVNAFKLFINAGSSSEYGIKNLPMTETDSIAPINDYGVTKSAETLFCQKIAHSEKLPVITFRLFSPYGYFEEKSRLIPSIILSILNNKQIKLSSPDFVRDFIFIDDVVNAFLNIPKLQHFPGEIFNIGSGKQHSIKDVVKAILQKTKTNPKIGWTLAKKQTRQVEPLIWQANISKAKKLLRWIPKYNLQSGIDKTFEWFIVNKNLYESK